MKHLYLILGLIIGICLALMFKRGKAHEAHPEDDYFARHIDSLDSFYEEEKHSERLRR